MFMNVLICILLLIRTRIEFRKIFTFARADARWKTQVASSLKTNLPMHLALFELKLKS